MLRVDVSLLQDFANLIDERRLRQLLARKVHTHEEVAIRVRLPLPFGQLFAGAPQNPHSDRNDQAGVFSQRNEIDGTDKAALRMLPTDQCLKPGKLTGIHGNDRLVMNPTLLAVEGAAQG